MRENFNKAMEFVLKWEGGYSNNPSDPGGETNYGISKRAHPGEDIANLTVERAKEIYLEEYWIPIGCDEMGSPMDIVAMDIGVNMGLGRVREFQTTAGDWHELILLRIRHYMKLRNKYPQFFLGWMNRTMDLYAYARES